MSEPTTKEILVGFSSEFALSEVSERTLEQMVEWIGNRIDGLYAHGFRDGRRVVPEVRFETWDRAYKASASASYAGPEFEAGANLSCKEIIKAAKEDGCDLANPPEVSKR